MNTSPWELGTAQEDAATLEDITRRLADLEQFVAGTYAELAAASGDATPDSVVAAPPELDIIALDEWVRTALLPLYRRYVGQQGGQTRWCAQWWEHSEAVGRLHALMLAARELMTAGTGPSVWWSQHADWHMPKLLAADGPFAECTPTKHTSPAILQATPVIAGDSTPQGEEPQ